MAQSKDKEERSISPSGVEATKTSENVGVVATIQRDNSGRIVEMTMTADWTWLTLITRVSYAKDGREERTIVARMSNNPDEVDVYREPTAEERAKGVVYPSIELVNQTSTYDLLLLWGDPSNGSAILTTAQKLTKTGLVKITKSEDGTVVHVAHPSLFGHGKGQNIELYENLLAITMTISGGRMTAMQLREAAHANDVAVIESQYKFHSFDRTYNYDGGKLIARMTHYLNDIQEKLEYDPETGRITSKKDVDADGNIKYRTYHPQSGEFISGTETSPQGEIYPIDANGNRIGPGIRRP